MPPLRLRLASARLNPEATPVMIHPSAVVHPDARLGRNVRIGPYAVIDTGTSIGPDCVIHAHAFLTHTHLGARNVVGQGAVIGADPQDLAFQSTTESSVRIGDGNTIREYCTIHRGTAPRSATLVGNECFLMAGVHLGHNVQVGNRVIIANNSLLGGYVRIADSVFIGGASVFHQYVEVGRLAICQGLSGLGKNVPPFTLAEGRNRVAGLNVVGLRRAGLSLAERTEIKRAFNLLYRQQLNTRQALEEAAKQSWGPLGREFFAFVEASKRRGICRLRRGREDAAID